MGSSCGGFPDPNPDESEDFTTSFPPCVPIPSGEHVVYKPPLKESECPSPHLSSLVFSSPLLEHTMDAVTLINKPCLLCGKTTAMWCGRCQNAWYCSPDHLQSVQFSSGLHKSRANPSPTPGLAQTSWRMRGSTNAHPHHFANRQIPNCRSVWPFVFARRWCSLFTAFLFVIIG